EGSERASRLAARRQNPMLCDLERLRRESVGAYPPLLRRAYKAATLQHAEMLHEGGQCHVERLGEFLHRGRAVCQPFEHGATGGIGQGVEDTGELLVRHMP